ncbi:MAG: tetratricopeptide (TPR) repeat protein [Flavobacteriales bacterium]|jgi:tetratricopeptide (TPR) repeat protein|tara:strand:+ start:2464 stop:2805 length:342 start_codon:yes stop_codon:yes gene_type:complete
MLKRLKMVSKNRKKVISIFDKNVEINCDEIQTFFAATFTQNPTLEKAKTINNLLAKKKCINCDLFIQKNDKILEAEPTAKRYSVAAKIFKQTGKLDISYEYFTKAIELETNEF